MNNVPQGWKLVPIEPTDKMREEFRTGDTFNGFNEGWKDALAAAPEPPTVSVKAGEALKGWKQIRDFLEETSPDCGLESLYDVVEGALQSDSQPIDVDALANFIRTVDGDNTMGAGELAEHIANGMLKAKGE